MRAKVRKRHNPSSLHLSHITLPLTYLSVRPNACRRFEAIVSIAESGVSLPQQLAAVRSVAGTLQKQGFRGQAIALAIRAVSGAPDALLGKPLNDNDEAFRIAYRP